MAIFLSSVPVKVTKIKDVYANAWTILRNSLNSVYMEGFSGSDHILHVGVKVAVIRYIFTGFVDQSCFGRHAGVPNFVESSISLLYMKVLC